MSVDQAGSGHLHASGSGSGVSGACEVPQTGEDWISLEDVPVSSLPPVSAGGWVAVGDIRAHGVLQAEIADLEAQREALSEELSELSAMRAAAMDEARAQGYAEASDEVRAVLKRLARAQQELAETGAAALALVARDVVAGLLRQALSTDHDALVRWIRDTLASRPGAGALRIRVNPHHAGALSAASPCPVQPDPRLAAGDAVIELPDGQLDLRLDHLAAVLAPTVEAALGRPQAVDEDSIEDILSRTVCTETAPEAS